MSRKIFFCAATWRDRKFQKSFSRLQETEQLAFLEKLRELVSSLQETPHPATDPKLRQAYKAKSYSGVVVLRGASLVEYSLDALARVIAKYPAREGSDAILLLAVTLDHDHDRLKTLIKNNRLEIDTWDGPEEPKE